MTRLQQVLAATGTLIIVVVAVIAYRFASPIINWIFFPRETRTVVETTLRSVENQNRLTVFAAVLSTSATTTEKGRFAPFTNRRQTLIQSGLVRYEVDLARLKADDLAWDGVSKTLTVTIPAPVPSKAEIDARNDVRYEDGEMLTNLLEKRDELTNTNRSAVYASLALMARSEMLMTMARRAAKTAVESNLQLPLGAVGVSAKVDVKFKGLV